VLEPLPLEQWYVNVQNLKKQAITVIKEGKLEVVPKNFENPLFQWLENLRDWNISRQNVWGIRIPVWYEVDSDELFTVAFIDKKSNHHQGKLSDLLQEGFDFEEITKGLQRVIAPITSKVVFEEQKQNEKRYLPETDTFDTWFSSGQWPIVTLKTAKPGDYEKFYPTAVLETAYDILKAWVSRMVMFGIYLTHEPPFKVALFHGIVNDPLGKKMSKSKGNVVNPLELVSQYGADAVRFALVYGNATGADQSLSYTKLDAARKFTNKIWNMARFLEMKKPEGMGELKKISIHELSSFAVSQSDKDMVEATKVFVREITKYLDSYQFNLAAERVYEFAWHTFADKYIEEVKNRVDENSYTVLANIYSVVLHLLHPIMPFVTEEIYQTMKLSSEPLIVSLWPEA
jgi:valyl-tRNA synthetase